MDEQTRYRVTGSLFLIAIAVIVFPMLFDGEGLPQVRIEPLRLNEEVPAVPRRGDLAPESDLIDRARELAAQTDAEGYLTDRGNRLGEPVLSEADASTRVWAVQVASFSDEDNALALRDRLRGDGYEAFISSLKRDDEVLSRVAVGPLLNREDADTLRRNLTDALALETRIVAFSN
jgi:DedD protein